VCAGARVRAARGDELAIEQAAGLRARGV